MTPPSLRVALCPERWSIVLLATIGCLLIGRSATSQQLQLQINPRNVSLTLGDPDTSPAAFTQPLVATYRVRNNSGSWQLTLLAEGDLIDGTAVIDISNVAWTATPAPPFQNGTLSKTVEQVLASGSGSVDSLQDGSVVFRLANSWTYAVGAYSATIVFTLTAP